MFDNIGELSGKIWHFLSENGETDVVHMRLSLKVNNSEFFMALGWLLREGKVAVNKDKANYLVKLTEQK